MKRFVSYLYSIYNNQKMHNAGFARMELRTGRNRVDIHLKENGYAGKTGTVYLFIRKQKNIQGISIGNITFRGNQADFRFEQAEENIGQTPWQIMQMNGILIVVDGRPAFLSQWDEEPVDTTHFEIWSEDKRTEENESEAKTENVKQNMQKEKPESVQQRQNMKMSIQKTKTQTKDISDEYQAGNSDMKKIQSKLKHERTMVTGDQQPDENFIARESQIKNKSKLEAESSVKHEDAQAIESQLKHKDAQTTESQLKHEDAQATESQLKHEDAQATQSRSKHENTQATQSQSKRKNTQATERQLKHKNMQAAESRLKHKNAQLTEFRPKNESLPGDLTSKMLSGEINENETAVQAGDIRTAELQPQPVDAWMQTWRYMLRIFPVLNHFQEKSNVLCVRIEIKDVRLLPEKYWSMVNNSFLLHGFFNYRYLVFGRIGQNWFVGIPGIYQNQEHVMASIFGFPDFLPQKDKNENGEQPGYWYRTLGNQM